MVCWGSVFQCMVQRYCVVVCHSLPVGGAQWGGDALRKHQLADGFVYPSAGVGTSHLKLVCVRGSNTIIIKHHILKHHILELRRFAAS